MAGPQGDYVPPDPTEIDIRSSEAVHFWSKTLSTPEEKIRTAVHKVGPVLEKVKQELGIGGVG